ncbi:CPBP family intramembrane glutamic endopeptidase [Chitinophaga sp. RCC_12]|uniref:CPBP family intramembrane glutamic endopeptidase n=1 Tax=Chitinophaga sp. RCC_12 TaxID=3239226 RepID=UPI0035232CBA
MKTTDNTRSIFDDDPLLAEKKKFYPTLGHAWLIPVYSLVVFLAFYIAAAGAYPGITNDKVLSSLITIPIYCSLLLVVLIYSYNRKKKVEPDYHLHFGMPSPAILLAGPFLMLSLYLFAFGVQEWLHLSALKEWDSVFLLIREKPLFYCFVYFLIDPFIQESLMRGVILDSFLKNYSPLKALLNVAAISFAFSLSPYTFLYTVSFSLMLSWIYMKTGNLGNTLYMQVLCGLIPALLVFILQDQFETSVPLVLNSTVWVGVSGVVAIICVIILQTSFPSTNKVIK